MIDTKPRAGSLDSKTRVRHGLQRERQIANALIDQYHLPIVDANPDEDKEHKVDRWINRPEGKVGLQIKYRESGKDMLFEVFDKWDGWDNPNNKLGRDMQGDAEQYAVLLDDRKTVVMIPTSLAKSLIRQMIEKAKKGWTVDKYNSKSLFHTENGIRMELKVQHDPADGRIKMIAYIPALYFVFKQQAEVYNVNLPVWSPK